MDPVPGEEHKKISADYIKCLSKVCKPYSLTMRPSPHMKENFMFIRISHLMLDSAQLFLFLCVNYTFTLSYQKKKPK